MKKANIDIGTQSKTVGTLDGTIEISLEELSSLYKKANGKEWKWFPYEKVAAVIVIFSALLGFTWKIACWKTKNDIVLCELQKKVDRGAGITPKNTNQNPVKRNRIKEINLPNTNYFHGQIGIINKKIIKNKFTSFNLPYMVNYNVCEYNSRYTNWTTENPTPKPLFFYKLINSRNNLTSWCIVIGKFNSTKFPNRVFIVSDKIANELGFTIRQGVLDINFVRMHEDEWRLNEECCFTRNIFFQKDAQ